MHEQEIIKKLQEGHIVGMPTDTIYGMLGLAKNKYIVERIYGLRKRNPEKPCIILIGDMSQIKEFGIHLSESIFKKLEAYWPGPVSIIFDCPHESFSYLHRGTKSLAFRLPNNESLRTILRATGPLVAPSLNLEGFPIAETIEEAKKYFDNDIVYSDGGTIQGKPSKVIQYNTGTNDFTIIRD